MLIYVIGQIRKLAKLRVVQNIERTKKSKICQFLEPNIVFPNFGIFLIFQIRKFCKFVNCSIWEIIEFSSLTNS